MHTSVRSVRLAALFFVFLVHGLFAGPVLGDKPDSARFAEQLPEMASHSTHPGRSLQQRAELHQWLLSESIGTALANPVRARVSASEAAAVDAPDSARPVRVGLTKALSVNVDFRDLSMSRLKGRPLGRNTGAITQTSDGGFVYTAALSSVGATALRVHFKGFDLPPNAGLYLFTDAGEVFGPYKGRGPLGDGEFWSHTLVGDLVMLQLRHVGPASDDELHRARFTVAGLGHIRPKFLAGTCADNAECVENAECITDTVVDDARFAVAHMQWISGPYIYICSGGLVADTDSTSEIPYFLSANHCISRGKDARNLENYFQLTKPCGAGSGCPSIFDIRDNHQDMRTLGASILSTGRDADYTLFQLKEMPPRDSVYLGWNSAPVAFTNGESLYRISHPGGSPQSYSKHEVDASAQTCLSWPRGDRIYSKDLLGATEGGSSGSPVINGTGQIVGQLSGACGYNLDNVCDSNSNSTVDGAFAAYYDSVSQWLDPDSGGGCSAEICDDTLDNDCDGAIDGADSDCGSSGDGGLPGEACDSDADCLSNRCKGKRGEMTCK